MSGILKGIGVVLAIGIAGGVECGTVAPEPILAMIFVASLLWFVKAQKN